MANPVDVIQTTHFRLKPYDISAWCNSNHRTGFKTYGKSGWCYSNHPFQTVNPPGVIQTKDWVSNHTVNPAGFIQTIFVCLKPWDEVSQTILTKILYHSVYQGREGKGQKSSRLSFGESQELLVQLTDIYPQTTICIDTLDEVETETRLNLPEALKNVIERSINLVKVFTTTRIDTDILWQFEISPRIELQLDDNIGDINRFVKTKLQISIDRRLLEGHARNGLQAKICSVLCRRSRGM